MCRSNDNKAASIKKESQESQAILTFMEILRV